MNIIGMAATTSTQIRCSGNITTLYKIADLLKNQDGRSRLELDLVDQTRTPSSSIAKCKFLLNVQTIITFGEDRCPFAAVENAAVACFEILKGLARCDIGLQRVILYVQNACATVSNPPFSREIQRSIVEATTVLPSAPPLVESPKRRQHDEQ